MKFLEIHLCSEKVRAQVRCLAKESLCVETVRVNNPAVRSVESELQFGIGEIKRHPMVFVFRTQLGNAVAVSMILARLTPSFTINGDGFGGMD